MILNVISAKYVDNYKIELSFDDSPKGIVDFSDKVTHMTAAEFENRLRQRYGDMAVGEDFELAEAFYRIEIK